MFLQKLWRSETPPPPKVSSSPERRETGSFHQLIEAQVAQTPNKIAVEFQDKPLTYRELNERANQIAHFLRKRGAGPEKLVGLGMKRSTDLVVGILAIWKSGAGYVPLDERFPKERLRYTLQDSQPIAVLTEEPMRHALEGLGSELIFVDSDWDKIARESKENPTCVTGSNHLAQLLYTSGSTGRPKGVEILHRGLVNFREWLKIEPGITGNDTILASTTAAFDTSAVELFMPLTVGARIVIVRRETGEVTRLFLQMIEECGVSVIQGTPTMLRWFVEFGWAGKKDLKIISGGEALSRELAEKLLPMCKELWNIYGPTEATIWATLTQVKSGPGPVPIGHPICNVQIHLLNSNLEAVSPGETGEVCIGGVGVARGYHNRPEETERRFIANPEGKPGDILYRTGDLGRRMPNGELEYLGRLDHQIKINGERIEPGEIEAAILRFPGVRQALVIAREDVPGEKRLVAYLIMEDGVALKTRELRTFLLSELPKNLVPPNFVALPQFPVLINGKIDRGALPRPGLPAGKTAF